MSAGHAVVEILSFEGCPNRAATRATVERIVEELGVDADVRWIDVADEDEARRRRFLGSPTVRVNGRDVEPGADERTDYALSCRVYRTESGFAGQPDEEWLRTALRSAR